MYWNTENRLSDNRWQNILRLFEFALDSPPFPPNSMLYQVRNKLFCFPFGGIGVYKSPYTLHTTTTLNWGRGFITETIEIQKKNTASSPISLNIFVNGCLKTQHWSMTFLVDILNGKWIRTIYDI